MQRARRCFSEICIVMGLCFAPGGIAVQAAGDEPAKPFARSEIIRIVPDAGGRHAALEFLRWPEATLAELKVQPDVEDVLARMLSIHVEDANARADLPTVLGTYAIDGKVVRFTPRYPFRAGMEYRITIRSTELKGAAANGGKAPRADTFVIRVPDDAKAQPAEVERVYPSAAVLPENHLRFYIHFSEPMSRGESYAHLRLLNKEGRPIERAFLELGEELWDASGRRLTLLIDPGRIKRGLQPREELGPVLESGQTYTLVIDAKFPDATGRPLVSEFRKSFKVAEPVTTAIDPGEWKVQPPRVGSTASLVVRFPRPLDRALMERSLAVVDATGQSVAGQVLIGGEERRWEYFPDEVWKAGSYQLVVDPVLEDVAGNQVGRPFEVDGKKPDAGKAAPAKVRIPFTIAKAPASAAAAR